MTEEFDFNTYLLNNFESVLGSVVEESSDYLDLLSYYAVMKIHEYERWGRSEDLEEAIRRAEQAAAATPNEHPDQSGRLGNLGYMLRSRFERTGRMEDLEEAIRRAEQAMAATPYDHPHLAGTLSNLGNVLQSRFERTGRMEDLEEAIRRAEQAVAATPYDHPHLAGILSNLGNMLERRSERTGRMEDLEEAIRRAEQAVAATPYNHPNLAKKLSNLGSKLQSRFERTGRMEDIISSLQSFSQAWNILNATPLDRLTAARSAIRILKSQADWSRAARLAVEAVTLLPVINNRSLTRQDQQHMVSRFSGLAVDACSLLLIQRTDSDHGAEHALQILELGRGAISNLLIDDRRDISNLKTHHPDHAATFERLQVELNKPSADKNTPQAPSVMLRTIIADQLQRCIDDIRTLPGYDRFLLPPSADELKKGAREGTIVVVNISDVRSDAIIVTTSTIQAIQLPHLPSGEVETWLGKGLTDFKLADLGSKNKEYVKFLAWLWDCCVEPIFHFLGLHSSVKDDQLPRLWWIGTGVANSLPFHAAGDHSRGSTRNTFSRVISSYTPTLKALGYARERASSKADVLDGLPRLLTASMPTTPGQRRLPGVINEVTRVEAIVRGRFEVLSLTGLDVAEMLKCLFDYDIVHFACHGMSHALDSSESCLILQRRRSSNLQPEPGHLTVRQISAVQLRRACIAYLSACSTAENKVMRLADEVIHLASGFQVAGFPHVIGSLWSSMDDVCLEIAQEFYRFLVVKPWSEICNDDVARALHLSILHVRSAGRNHAMPLLWAQYVHLGA